MTTQDFTQVPGRSHYSLEYFQGGRIFSYAHQIKSVLSVEPRTVIEIGPGVGMVTAALRSIGVEVTTVDVQPELKPDVVASVTDLPFEDGRFDVVLCGQVLEHLPFDSFAVALREMRRVSRAWAILSLPDITRSIEISWRLPLLPAASSSFFLPRSTNAAFRAARLDEMGHYWEIGFPETPLRRICAAIRSGGWELRRTWRVSELPWHRYFQLKADGITARSWSVFPTVRCRETSA